MKNKIFNNKVSLLKLLSLLLWIFCHLLSAVYMGHEKEKNEYIKTCGFFKLLISSHNPDTLVLLLPSRIKAFQMAEVEGD